MEIRFVFIRVGNQKPDPTDPCSLCVRLTTLSGPDEKNVHKSRANGLLDLFKKINLSQVNKENGVALLLQFAARHSYMC